MPRRIEQHPHGLLRLEAGERRTELDRMPDGGRQVTDLDVQVHHHLLLPLRGRPDGTRPRRGERFKAASVGSSLLA